MSPPNSKPADDKAVQPSNPHLSPGDEAPPGTPGTGENVCRACGGSGQVNGQPCRECEGTGSVVTGIGGA